MGSCSWRRLRGDAGLRGHVAHLRSGVRGRLRLDDRLEAVGRALLASLGGGFRGGNPECGEEPIATANRGAWEGSGLPRGDVLESLGGLEPVTTRNRAKPIVPVVARIERPAEFVADPREVDVIIEPTIKELLDESRWVTRDWFGHDLWFYEFPEGILWGATAFMMRELLDYFRTGD